MIVRKCMWYFDMTSVWITRVLRLAWGLYYIEKNVRHIFGSHGFSINLHVHVLISV